MMYILSKDKVYYNLKKNDSVTSQNRCKLPKLAY